MDWAAEQGIGLDFNSTFFSHPKAADGFTLAHRDEGIRRFWVEHGIACRKIGEAFGRRQGTPVHPQRLDSRRHEGRDHRPQGTAGDPQKVAGRDVCPARSIAAFNRDSVEGKLFGIGSETYVVGSHEFYLGYAVANKTLLTLDAGHFHPTESIADKISSVLLFVRRDAVARQPRHPLGQRPRGDPQRRVAGHRRGARPRRHFWTVSTSAWTSSTPASTALRPG